MKILRLLSLLLLASQLSVRAVPVLSLSDTWSETALYDAHGSITPLYTNGTASLKFSGLKMTNPGPINSSTRFSLSIGKVSINLPLAGDKSDTNNPVFSFYTPGKTHVTFSFCYRQDDHTYVEVRKLRINWADNVLSGSFSARTGIFGFQSFIIPPPSNVVGSATCLVSLGSYSNKLRYDYKWTNNVSNSVSAMFITGSIIGTSHFRSPEVTVTSPARNVSTTNPVLQVTGVNTAFNGTGQTVWRWAAPTDDPSSGPEAFAWNAVDNPGTLQTNRTLWSTSTQLAPGTNWFWAVTSDSIGNPSPIVTRKIFYSVRSPLTLATNGNGTITGGRGVTNGAMLEIGRGYTVSAKSKDTNAVFRDWRDHDFNILSTANPYNFLMQSNAFIAANFIRNPFLAIIGTYSGIFTDPDNPATVRNSGYITFTVKADGTYSGTVLYGAQKLPFFGKLQFDIDDPFFDDPDAVNSVFIAGRSPLEGELRFPSDGSGHLLPTPTIRIDAIRMGVWYPFLPALPFARSSTNAVTPGLYNFVDNVASLNIGGSYGSVVVTPKGQANVVMHPADGSPAVTFSTPICKDGLIAIFIPLNGGDGMILATLNLEFLFPFHSGGGRWVKPANARAKVYPAGFVENLDLVIGRYTPDIGKSILTNFGVGEIDIANNTNYSAQFIYSPANNRIIAMPDQLNVTMNLTFDPATGLVAGTITFAGHSPFHINALIGGENIGYTLDTDHSMLVVLRATPLASLGSYDDGFVLADESSTDAELGATAFFSFRFESQLVTVPVSPPPPPPPSFRDVIIRPPTIAVQVLMHREVQVAPSQYLIVTDTFDSMDVQHPGLYPALPSVGPYIGTNNPADYTAPAVNITPTQRVTRYIGY